MPVLVQLVEQVRHPMKVVTDSHAHNGLKSVLDGVVLDGVVQDADGTLISRRDAQGDAVVMSLGYYNSRMETLHLLSMPANAAALARAIRQDKAGQSQARDRITDGG
jgi:antitoxin YefM